MSDQPAPERRFLTVEQVAEELNVGEPADPGTTQKR